MKAYTRSWFALVVLAVTVVGVIALWPRPARAAGPWYVKPGGSDSNSCLSAGSPCATINGAIGKASSGDMIYVAIGTYTSTLIDRDITLSGGWNAGFTTQSGMSTIDGEGAGPGIAVGANVGSGMTAIIERFFVQNGVSSGIRNYGNLTLNQSVVRGNTAYEGGGIYNAGELTINDSAITGNTAIEGGGILQPTLGIGSGILILNNSTVSGNSATVVGPADMGSGGGIQIWDGVLILNSSTVSGNTAFRGGGGIKNNGTVTLQNTILADNIASSSPDCSGTINSSGYNLVGDPSGCNYALGTGDVTNMDAKLGPLFGAPGYHPLSLGSPAIDAGNPAGCSGSAGLLTTDQRGAARVGRCDIGAYEYTTPGPAVSLVAVAGSSQRTAPNFTFEIPLQAATLDSIGSPVAGVTVTFSAPTSGASGAFVGGTFTATASTDLVGVATAALFTANGLQGSYVVTATASGVVTPATFSLTNFGWYVAVGGNDANTCQTPAAACSTINGVLAKSGFVSGDTVLVATGTYTGAGTEVVLLNKNVRLLGGWNGTFTNQGGMSTIDGGGARQGITVNSSGGVVSIERFTVQNGASDYGGGIRSANSTLSLNNSIIRNNSAGYPSGGGIWVCGGAVTLNDSSVTGNSGYRGGGILNDPTYCLPSSVLTLNHSTVSGNTATTAGGGILNQGILVLNNSAITGNLASGGGGGGIANEFASTATLNSSTVNDNVAYGDNGGGMYSGGTLILNNSTVSNNRLIAASNYGGQGGGGIYYYNPYSGYMAINNSTISGNLASGIYGSGGGFYSAGGTVTLQNTIVAGNTVSSYSPDCYGYPTSAGYNLIGNLENCNLTPTTGDLTNVDARLGPLQNNGGPTLTHALRAGSPAIDAGNPAGCTDSMSNPLTTDQRGWPRTGPCDIGAYEYFATKQVIGSFKASGVVTYTISLNNIGGATTLNDMMLTDTLPISLTYVSGSFSATSGVGGESGGVITWTGTIITNTETLLTYAATVSPTLPVGSVITNTAQINWRGIIIQTFAQFDTFIKLFLPLIRR
jgi:uncharacterized repeat protein (TIGR01451 family)